MQTREQLIKKFNTSRSNLLAMIIFTSINLVLILTYSDWYFPFSANIPILLLVFSETAIGISAAFISLAIYVVFWALMKKYRTLIIAILVYFSLDTLIFLLFFIFVVRNHGLDFMFIVEIAFAVWIMTFLISGTAAWMKLKKLPPEEYTPQGEPADDKVVAPSTVEQTIPVAQMPFSTALRKPSKRGRTLISLNYNNMEITVKRALGVTELIVNGMVYAEKTGMHEGKTYLLEANVSGTVINATTIIPSLKDAIQSEDPPTATVYLYVNGNLLAEKVRKF